jgi:hypothetical protein
MRADRRLTVVLPLACALSVVLLALCACTSSQPSVSSVYSAKAAGAPFAASTNAFPDRFFTSEIKAPTKQYASQETVTGFSSNTVSAYHLGPGDKFAFLVRGREDVSLPSVTVSPDGAVALPLAGIVQVGGCSACISTSQRSPS